MLKIIGVGEIVNFSIITARPGFIPAGCFSFKTRVIHIFWLDSRLKIR